MFKQIVKIDDKYYIRKFTFGWGWVYYIEHQNDWALFRPLYVTKYDSLKAAEKALERNKITIAKWL